MSIIIVHYLHQPGDSRKRLNHLLTHTMKREPTYLSGEPIQLGDSVRIGDWGGTVEEIIVEACPQWDEYWKAETGEGVMLVGPKFGRLFNRFQDEELVLVHRNQK